MENLRSIIREILKEAGPKIKLGSLPSGKISASSEYLKKEDVKQHIEDLIISKIKLGEVKNQTQLNELITTIDTAMTTLRIIPFEGYSAKAKKGR